VYSATKANLFARKVMKPFEPISGVRVQDAREILLEGVSHKS
jgi:hypothetical protein